MRRERNEAVLASARQQSCCSCGASPPNDPSHIRSVGAGGPDEEWNLLPMCRRCHTLWHGMGWYTFITVYPSVRLRLESLGWEISLSLKLKPVLWHPGLAGSKDNQ